MYEVNLPNSANNILSFQLDCFVILSEIFLAHIVKKLIKWIFY